MCFDLQAFAKALPGEPGPTGSEVRDARRRQHRLKVENEARPLSVQIERILRRIAEREASQAIRDLGIVEVAKIIPADLEDLRNVLENFGGARLADSTIQMARRLGVDPDELGGVRRIRQEAEIDLAGQIDVILAEFETGTQLEISNIVREIIEQAQSEFPRPTQTEIASRIREAAGRVAILSPTRAEDISRRYTTGVENAGIDAAYREAGIVKIEWVSILSISAIGNPPRWWHREMDGETTAVGVPFKVPNPQGGVDLMRYPGDPRAPGEQTRYCRCTTSPVK